MTMLFVGALALAAGCAGCFAAIGDGRRGHWRRAQTGLAVSLAAIASVAALAMVLPGGSIWHSAVLWPALGAFAACYLITRLATAAAGLHRGRS